MKVKLSWFHRGHSYPFNGEQLREEDHYLAEDVSKQYTGEYTKGAKAELGNNTVKGELINPEEPHLLTVKSVNEKFDNTCGRGNNDDPESGKQITQPKDCFNAHLRSILLVIFSVFTITLLVMIRCSAYRVPSFFRHSPLLLKGFTSSLLLAVIFSLLSLETMSKGNKFARYFAYIAILSSTAAVGSLIALAFLQAI